MRKKNMHYQSAQHLSGQRLPSEHYLPQDNAAVNEGSKLKKASKQRSQQVSLYQQNSYPVKGGVYGVDDYITGLYCRPKFQGYKGVHEKDVSARLPYISPVNEFNDESKLMSQIRRAQNRIQLMRHNRYQFGNSNNGQYEMLRPLIDLQNHNMMNMQMMMMVSQQNKQQCCGHPNMNCGGNGQAYYGCGHGGQQNNCRALGERESSEIKTLKERIERLQKEKKRGKDKKVDKDIRNMSKDNSKCHKRICKVNNKRKFRVAVIAVMFSLLFPKYATKFTDKRFQLHSERFFNQKQSIYQKTSLLFFKEIQKINCYRIAKTVKQYRKQKVNQQKTTVKAAKLVISQQSREQRSYEIYLGDIELFLLQFLKQFQALLQKGGLDDTLRSLGQINLPYSFPCDFVYILQELYRLNCHPKKLYLCISSKHSKALILSQIFVKALIFNYLFTIRQNAQWKKGLMKQNNLTNDQKIQGQMVATQMYISGVLLHRSCMDIIRDMTSSSKGNLAQINPNSIPIPLQNMAYDNSKDPVGNQSGSHQKFNQSSQRSFDRGPHIKLASSSSLRLQQNEGRYLNNFEYIKNLRQFNTLIAQIQKKSDRQAEVKSQIMNILNMIQQKLKTNRKREYKEIKEGLLKNEKHILKTASKGKIYEMPNRTEKEKGYIESILKIVKESKVRQANGQAPSQSYQRISSNNIFQMQRDKLVIQERTQGQQNL